MMNKNEFFKQVEARVGIMGQFNVSLKEVTKNNGLVLHGLTVQKEDEAVCPNIYLDGYYSRYENGDDLDTLVKEIVEVAEKHSCENPFGDVASNFMNTEFVKNNVVMTLVNTKKNEAMLEEIPHKDIEDLSVIYKVLISSDKEGDGTITIRNEHMKYWDVTPEELHAAAVVNTKRLRPTTIQSMNEVMAEIFRKDGMPEEIAEAMLQEMPMNQTMWVLSNKTKIHGAVSMLDTEALSELSKKLKTDLYILPSSIHEVIVVSTDMGTPESLSEMVREVNGSEVSEEEQLSDHVYHFNGETLKAC